MRLGLFAAPLMLALLVLGAGSAHEGHALQASDFSFTHHVGVGSEGKPAATSTTFSVHVTNLLSERVGPVTATVYAVGTALPLTLKQDVGALEPHETRLVTFKRGAMPSPYFCVKLSTATGESSEAVCSVAGGVTLP